MQEIQKDVKADEPVIANVAECVKTCQEVIKDVSSDQDYVHYKPTCDKIQEDWASLFEELICMLKELQSSLPEAQRGKY